VNTRIKPLVKLNSRLLPLLVLLLIGLQIAFPYRGWVILLVGLAGVWAAGAVWAKSLAKNLTLRREMRFGWAHVGDWIEERFTLINTGYIPAPWVEVIDHTTMPGYTASRVSGVEATAANRWHTRGQCTQRGVFTLGPTTLRTGDPFGLYTVTLSLAESTSLTVTPPIVPLPTIQVATGGRTGEGRSRPNPFERTVASNGVRPYTPGDSLSRIHWPTSARRNQFFVHQLDSTPAGDWWIFLDLDQTVQLGQGFESTIEHGVILAASLADAGLRADRAVALVTHGERLVWLPPETGDTQRRKILRELALVNPGPVPLSDLLARARPKLGQISSLIIVTANATGQWLEALPPLMQRGAIPTVLLLEPASFGAASAPNQTQSILRKLGIAHHIITKNLLDRPEARPGEQGEWQWQILPSGRAVPISRPRDMRWKALG